MNYPTEPLSRHAKGNTRPISTEPIQPLHRHAAEEDTPFERAIDLFSKEFFPSLRKLVMILATILWLVTIASVIASNNSTPQTNACDTLGVVTPVDINHDGFIDCRIPAELGR